MTRFALVASVALASLGCARTSADGAPVAIAPDAAPPPQPAFPSRSDILSSYVDASTLRALSGILAGTGLSVCSQAFAMGSRGGGAPNDAARAEYRSECEKLPPPVQRCLGLLYESSHVAECKEVFDGLDAGVHAMVDHLQNAQPAPP